jgi:hypothetical protein|tara:strand:- start:106 stop:291 length:186 start_codon:yes stop_codon:yes gene_type:complete
MPNKQLTLGEDFAKIIHRSDDFEIVDVVEIGESVATYTRDKRTGERFVSLTVPLKPEVRHA